MPGMAFASGYAPQDVALMQGGYGAPAQAVQYLAQGYPSWASMYF